MSNDNKVVDGDYVAPEYDSNGSMKIRKVRNSPEFKERMRRQEVTKLPPTPGLYKLGQPAQAAARSRAKAFYPFD